MKLFLYVFVNFFFPEGRCQSIFCLIPKVTKNYELVLQNKKFSNSTGWCVISVCEWLTWTRYTGQFHLLTIATFCTYKNPREWKKNIIMYMQRKNIQTYWLDKIVQNKAYILSICKQIPAPTYYKPAPLQYISDWSLIVTRGMSKLEGGAHKEISGNFGWLLQLWVARLNNAKKPFYKFQVQSSHPKSPRSSKITQYCLMSIAHYRREKLLEVSKM